MRYSVIFNESFGLLKHWSFALIVPALVGLFTKEYYIMAEFLVLFGVVFAISAIMQRAIMTDDQARVREGLMSIAISWLFITLIGSSIYIFNLGIPFLDGFFESMSSWTTTGLSVLEPEGLPLTILFWRSFGQWVGGLGVVILAAGNLFKSSNALFIAEGRNDRIKPNIINSFQIMSGIYVLYTLLGLVALWIFGMSFFEAINHSMTAIATGGMSTKNASIAAFPALGVQVTLLVMMILGNISFYHHYHLLQGNFKRFFKSMQNISLALLIVIPTLVLLAQTSFFEGLFHVVSSLSVTVTTTCAVSSPASSRMFILVASPLMTVPLISLTICSLSWSFLSIIVTLCFRSAKRFAKFCPTIPAPTIMMFIILSLVEGSL